MDTQKTSVTIPQWNGKTGNYKKDRFYYNAGPKYGKRATIDKFIYHWMDGTLAGTDATFKNSSKIRSAHFGIEDTRIHQYVSIQDTSFNSGKGDANCEGIGIEHSAQPGRDASAATYETSSQVVYAAAKALGKKVGNFQHLPHNHFSETACPGTIDIDRIVRRAIELEEGDISIVTTNTVVVPVKAEGRVTAKQGVKVRVSPNTNQKELRLMKQNDGFWYVGVTPGELIEGNSIWLVLEDGHFCWSGATNYQPNQQVT